jgi:hypothetical protein
MRQSFVFREKEPAKKKKNKKKKVKDMPKKHWSK